MQTEVLIIGGGLAGLCCARILHQQGIPFQLLEASDKVGGRVRTDLFEGFRLDRGFQVFLTSYPEAKSILNYEALHLKPFLPGALVRYQGKFHELTDPWRRPLSAVRSLLSPVGTFTDKLRIAAFRSRTLKGSVEDLFQIPETNTLKSLENSGFSTSIIERFFRPFLGGIFLDAELTTSSRMLDFVFRMFATGQACLPSEGMEAIPQQLSHSLPSECIRLNTKVAKVSKGLVTLAGGETLSAKTIVVATEGSAARDLLGEPISAKGQGTTCFYFSAAKSPIEKPILILNGDGRGPINNLCVPTSAVSAYGPSNQSLISVTVLGTFADSEAILAELRGQLKEWFGADVEGWKHLRTYSIPYALPDQTSPALSQPERPALWADGIYVCGDHRDNASINGAMTSGRRAAEAILKERA